MSQPYEMKLYVVVWGDAWSTSEYYKKGGDHSPMIVTDVGFLCTNNEETIVLCRSYAENGAKRTLITIPHVNVISITELTT